MPTVKIRKRGSEHSDRVEEYRERLKKGLCLWCGKRITKNDQHPTCNRRKDPRAI